MFHVKHLDMIRIFYLLSLLLLINCGTQYRDIHNGDLIFVEAENKNLSGAISNVTKDSLANLSFDHVGLIEKKNHKIWVLHANTKNGSEKEKLKSFIKHQSKDRTIAVYRLKNNYQFAIDSAIVKANNMLGKPYNFSYILNENSYYCSDFIERAFRNNHIFELNPMTFINPNTNKTDEFWMDYYKKMNIEVPEGKLGCNPNGLSKSDKLEKVLILKH